MVSKNEQNRGIYNEVQIQCKSINHFKFMRV